MDENLKSIYGQKLKEAGFEESEVKRLLEWIDEEELCLTANEMLIELFLACRNGRGLSVEEIITTMDSESEDAGWSFQEGDNKGNPVAGDYLVENRDAFLGAYYVLRIPRPEELS